MKNQTRSPQEVVSQVVEDLNWILGDLEQCAEESDLETLRDNIEDAAGILHDCSQEIFDLEMFLYQKVRGIDLPRSCKELDEANAG